MSIMLTIRAIEQMYQHDLKPLLKLALPLVLTGLVGACIGFFETVFLAHLSHKAMAAGALVSWLFGVFVVIIFGRIFLRITHLTHAPR
jgi:multidrug resistance protein, MATE family